VVRLLADELQAVVRWQDRQSGVWYQVMDAPGREGNYLESTCSAMFAYSLLKAWRMGYVGSDCRDAGIKAYRGILQRFIRVEVDSTLSLTQCCAVAGLGPGLSPKVLEAAPGVRENRRRDGSYAYYLSETSTKLEKAEQMSKRTILVEPENPTYLDTYAWILYKMGRAKEALQYMEKAVKNDKEGSKTLQEHLETIKKAVR
jgi:tetratricopeptide (TPR) repeat protein